MHACIVMHFAQSILVAVTQGAAEEALSLAVTAELYKCIHPPALAIM
jgi:hypothetical protein